MPVLRGGRDTRKKNSNNTLRRIREKVMDKKKKPAQIEAKFETIRDWKAALNQFVMLYEDRVPIEQNSTCTV